MEFWGILDQTTTSAAKSHCTPFVLPANGHLRFELSTMTLLAQATFIPHCTRSTGLDISLADTTGDDSSLRDPFYASTFPAVFALAATTVVAYMLVIMLFISPRSFVSGGMVVLGRRSFTNGPSGAEGGIGVGGRPWLQKVAALTVAISLTIATVNTFGVAEDQYDAGTPSATVLVNTVNDGEELKIMRIISETFLWLAQAQTLIRLFPRQREKVIIKWTALALITLYLLFSVLNQFVYEGSTRPAAFKDAVPALSYLFHLSLGLLYCAWVIYYAILKKQYAFYHPQMWNICLLALIALIAVLVPVVFFVLDIARPDVAIWGDYVRWVGAAAASVVVWEWVERIEALERNDKKDGVLGREIFDGDEMLEVTPSMSIAWNRRLQDGRGDDDDRGGTTTGMTATWPAMNGIANRVRPRTTHNNQSSKGQLNPHDHNRLHHAAALQLPPWPSRPLPVVTPVSRTDSGSAESTLYAVRYHPIGEAVQPLPGHRPMDSRTRRSIDLEAQQDHSPSSNEADKAVTSEEISAMVSSGPLNQTGKALVVLQAMNPFSKKRKSPPIVVSAHTPKIKELQFSERQTSRWDVLGKVEEFATTHVERLRDKTRQTEAVVASLPVTRIPAPPRRRSLREISEELDLEDDNQPPFNVRTVVLEEPVSRVTQQSQDSITMPPGSPPSQPVGSDINAGVAPRSAVSFAPANQNKHDEREHQAISAARSDSSRRSGTASQGRSSSSISNGTSLHTRSPEIASLPVFRVLAPATPRRIEGDSAPSRSLSPEAASLPVLRIPALLNPRRLTDE